MTILAAACRGRAGWCWKSWVGSFPNAASSGAGGTGGEATTVGSGGAGGGGCPWTFPRRSQYAFQEEE